MLILLAITLSHAATPTVLGVGDARSVVLLVGRGAEERAARCDDLNGDGAWSCPLEALPARPDVLGLLIDGTTLLSTTGFDLGDTSDALVVERVGAVLRVETSPPPPRSATASRHQGASALLIEVQSESHVEPGSPRLRATGEREAVDLSCEDGGVFPDRQANDRTWTCAAISPDGDLRLSLRLPGGGTRDLGSLRWPPEQGLRQVRVDASTAAVASWPILSRGSTATRQEDTPRREDIGAARAPQPNPGGSQSGAMPPHGGQPGGASPGRASPGGGSPGDGAAPKAIALSALTAMGLGLLAWRVAMGRQRPVPHASLVPLPAFITGGPAGSAIYRVDLGRSAEASAWLAGRASRLRPVLLVGAGSPSHAEGPIWVARSRDADDLADAARAIAARTPCPPLIVATPGAISYVGAVGISPESALLRALPDGAILALLHEDGPIPVALPEITLNVSEGEWRVK